MSEPFPPTALWRRHAQTVRVSSSSYKIEYVIVIKTFLNNERASKSHWCFISSPIAGRRSWKCVPNLSIIICLFRTFSPRLEDNDISKCSSDSFVHTLRYVVNVENCQNYLEMFQCPPIAGRRSKIALKFVGLRISECNSIIWNKTRV